VSKRDRQLADNRELGSLLIQTLEHAWNALRQVLPSLPPAVLTLIDAKSRQTTYGYVAYSVWRVEQHGRHEVGINPQLMSDPPALLATLIHEAAHAILHGEHGHGGVTPNTQYHRKEFRNTAENLGLLCRFNGGRHGWNLTRWPDLNSIPKKYHNVLKILEAELPQLKERQPVRLQTNRPLPKKGQIKLICNCPRPRVIYVSRTNAEIGGIVCELCKQVFQNNTQENN